MWCQDGASRAMLGDQGEGSPWGSPSASWPIMVSEHPFDNLYSLAELSCGSPTIVKVLHQCPYATSQTVTSCGHTHHNNYTRQVGFQNKKVDRLLINIERYRQLLRSVPSYIIHYNFPLTTYH